MATKEINEPCWHCHKTPTTINPSGMDYLWSCNHCGWCVTLPSTDVDFFMPVIPTVPDNNFPEPPEDEDQS